MEKIIIGLKRNPRYPTAEEPLHRFDKELGEAPWRDSVSATISLDDPAWELLRWPKRLRAVIGAEEAFLKSGNPNEVYWWVRLGDVAEYEKFGTFDEAKEYVEQATDKPFSEVHWINPYGFELGGYRRLNYISFFEGDEAAQPTEHHLYGKVK